MNADIVLVLRESAVKEKLEPLGVLVASSRPEQLAAKKSADTAMWRMLIEAANIKVE